MNTSRSFDRAAGYYDQTRPLPEPVAKEGIQAILDLTGPEARFLEAGAGTGRISIPLLKRGVDLIGCDLSLKMLRRLHEKFPAARIAQSDAARLPFSADRFDIVMTVHVLHLVPVWRDVLRELRRVLVPGGVYLNVRTWAAVGATVREQVRLHWRGWLAEHGIDARLPGLQNRAELEAELQSLGAEVSETEVVRYPLNFTLQEEMDRFESRIYSDSWEIPDDIFDLSIRDLRAWTQREYGDLNQPRQDELRFAIDIARFATYNAPGHKLRFPSSK